MHKLSGAETVNKAVINLTMEQDSEIVERRLVTMMTFTTLSSP
jgi:hypothetical protein